MKYLTWKDCASFSRENKFSARSVLMTETSSTEAEAALMLPSSRTDESSVINAAHAKDSLSSDEALHSRY